MLCPICKKQTDLFFCPNCGKVLSFPAYISGNKKLESEFEQFVKDLVNEANEKKLSVAELASSDQRIKEAVFRKYYEHIAYLKSLCSNPEVDSTFAKSGSSIIERMESFAKKCETNECQIAVVGTIKAGKSMFLNAVIGREVASTYPTPETAALTKFRYSDHGNYVKVSYYSGEEWDKLWQSVMAAKVSFSARDDKEDFISEYNRLNADQLKAARLNRRDDVFANLSFDRLKEIVELYTSAKQAEHFFAKEVEVGLSEFNVPKNVVFVDTPGLNDPVSFRSDITKNYIASANVVLLCKRASAAEITADELETIGTLFSEMRWAKERIYLFGTQYDIQDNFEDYWTQYTKPELVKNLSGKSYFESKQIAEERIIPISAWYYLLAERARQDRTMWQEGSKDELSLVNLVNKSLGVSRRVDPESRFYESYNEIIAKTNVDKVRDLILNGPVRQAEHIIAEDIKKYFVGICSEVGEMSDSMIQLNHDLLAKSQDHDILQEIKRIEREIETHRNNHAQNEKMISDALAEIDALTTEMIKSVKQSSKNR